MLYQYFRGSTLNLHKYTPFPLGLVKNIPKTHGRQVNPEIPSAVS